MNRAAEEALLRICKRHGWDPIAIWQVIQHESRWDSSNENPNSGAVGLIQWTRPNIPERFTYEQFRNLSALEQMPFVEEWFSRYLIPGETRRGAYYATVFLPGYYRMGKDPLTERGEKYYEQNPTLDPNQDGFITLDDLESVMAQHEPPAWFRAAAAGSSSQGSKEKKSPKSPGSTSTSSGMGKAAFWGISGGLLLTASAYLIIQAARGR